VRHRIPNPELSVQDSRAQLTIGLPGTIVPPFASIAKNAQRSEAAGADTIWFPDHVMGFWPQSLWTPDLTPLARLQPNPHAFFDPFIAMSAAAQATSRVRLGTAVTQPMSRHPAHLAQALLTLAHQSGGRALLGLGTGEAENLEPYGVTAARPAARLAEAIRIIRLLWSSPEPVSFNGDFWTLRHATLGLSPTDEAPAPPIWLAAHGPRTLRAAGELADGWLPLKMPLAEYEQRLRAVSDAAAAANRVPDAVTAAVWGFTVVHERESEVEHLLEHPLIKAVCLMFEEGSFQRHGVDHPLGRGRNGFRDYIPSRLDRQAALAAVERVPLEVVRDHLFTGTPQQILAELRQLAGAGARHAVLWNITFLADPALAAPSFKQLEELMAELRRH
jgi:phthiodiolone/phenolphthiodiolone dimycocerosates ketoreductase